MYSTIRDFVAYGPMDISVNLTVLTFSRNCNYIHHKTNLLHRLLWQRNSSWSNHGLAITWP